MNTTELQEKQAPRMQWIRPNCYYCGQLMFSTRHHAVENVRIGQTYIKTTYVCPQCNYWEFIKVPRALAATLIDSAMTMPVEQCDKKEPGVTNVLDLEAQAPLSGYPQMRFVCHFCPKVMYLTNRHMHEDTRTGQTFVKSKFVCPRCDYWKTAKVPQALAATVVNPGEAHTEESPDA